MSRQVMAQGRYRIERLIGDGGASQVHLAFDQQRQARVAIKVLNPRQADNRTAVQRFLQAASLLSQLQHPNIVRMFEVFTEDGSYCLVMEYVDGQTLQKRLGQGPLPIDQAVYVTESVCQALSYAHSSGVIHRDVKAGNIMLGKDGVVKVTDFGIARLITDGARDARPSGSLESMAPEVINGQPANERSEVYSVGVVLYQMLTGQLPFRAEDAAAMAYQHVATPPPQMERVSKAVSDVVSTALAKDPRTRYPSTEALAAALREAVAASRSVQPAPPSGHPWLVALTALLIVAVLILLIYALLNLIGAPSGAGEILPQAFTTSAPAGAVTPRGRIAYTVASTPRQHYKIRLINADGSNVRKIAGAAVAPDRWIWEKMNVTY